ncbi:hypothetical protein H4R33_002138 [Dimargaris cristalligena]|uniref:Phosphatidylinositol transfer protein alpha isoform n=1 Tax=Dimargaris cristalligena TaxID=215637 RepID=A0A4V1J527_9FUNG|nr:hypothetical protein H4R33_002138 [Dimargaris cristalligena]RKP37599.1 phosphatidylinositol transfer protein alpha isoform [Dimargaris cristalligena]|eukprot:RKP37599.1 phosphatidylinositol transfer protein alpha isoform [Dimargaris cristalligena]
MVVIKEYRIVNNCTVEEYQVAQLYAVAQASKNETGGGEGVEVQKNEPYDNEMGKGQYTYKVYHLASRLPSFISKLAPASALLLYEEAWNGYPHCKTVLTSPFMGDKFKIVYETMHVGNDRGELENALSAPANVIKKRQVVRIDLANDKPDKYIAEEDPTKYHSEKTGRGPLKGDWMKTCEPTMTCYKLVTAEFVWFGLQGIVESFIHKAVHNLFISFHRQLFCWTDQWYGLSIQDIRDLEAKTAKDLEELRKQDKAAEPTTA